jgi:hypothetical protein
MRTHGMRLRFYMFVTGFLLVGVVLLAGIPFLHDDESVVVVDFEAGVRLLEGLEVLIDGEPAGQLRQTGAVARTGFPVEEGEHTIVVAHPEWECEPARFTLEAGGHSIVLFLALRRTTDAHGDQIRQLVFMI